MGSVSVTARDTLRAGHVAAYRQALTTFLESNYLTARVNALEQLLVAVASTSDRSRVQNSSNEMRQFITARHTNVAAELARL